MKSSLEIVNSSSTLGEVYSQDSYVIKIVRNLKNVDCFLRVYPVPAPILLYNYLNFKPTQLKLDVSWICFKLYYPTIHSDEPSNWTMECTWLSDKQKKNKKDVYFILHNMSTEMQSKSPVIIKTVNQIAIQITCYHWNSQPNYNPNHQYRNMHSSILVTVSYIQRRYWSVIIQQSPYRFVFSRRNINIDYIYINPDLLWKV